MRIAALAFLFPIISGCAQFPEINDATSEVARDAEYLELIPLEPIRDVLDGPEIDPTETSEALQERVAGLKSRANKLRGPVLSANDRARLEETPQ